MYVCEICKKEFKTTQHLNQHKNRKKMCTLSNKHLNEVVTLPTKTASNDLNITEIMSFIKTAEGIQSLLNDKKLIDDYKNTIYELEQENNKLKEQLTLIQKVISIQPVGAREDTNNKPNECIVKKTCKYSKKNSNEIIDNLSIHDANIKNIVDISISPLTDDDTIV